MTRAARISISLITLFASLGLYGLAFAQSRDTSSSPTSPPQLELVSSTHSILIEDVRFKGLNAIDATDLHLQFDQQRTGLKKDAPFELAKVPEGASIITRMLADFGFMNAYVGVRIEDISAISKRITFVVEEGPPAVIREIRFDGNKVFSDDELRSQFQSMTEMSHSVYYRALVRLDIDRLVAFMQSRGYLEAKIAEPILNALNGNLTINLSVDEGRQYRVGEINITGSKLFSPEQIIETLGIKRGSIADRGRLGAALYVDLQSLYANRGYARYSSKIESEFRVNPSVENSGFVDYRINIIEGKCYKIASVEIPGNKNHTTQELQPFLLFKEGETYNRQLIWDTLKALRKSDLVNPLRLEVNAVYSFNEELGLIGLIIKVEDY